jgi:hypothetical protein
MSTSGRTQRLSNGDADELAAALDLDLDDVAICHACLSFVVFAIDSGDEREIRSWTAKMTPDLWEEGLALPVRLALERARERRVADAALGIADVESLGPRSAVARAVVRLLAGELSARARGDLLKMGFEPWPPRDVT